MKRGGKLLILAAALVVVLGAYLLMDRLGVFDGPKEEDTAVTVTGTDAGDVTGMSWSWNGEDLALEKENDSWQYAPDPDFPLNPTNASAMASAVGKVTATRQLDVPEDLGEYGLDAPSLTVTAEYSSAGEKTYLIGDKNEVSGDYYMMLKGGDTVFMIGDAIVSAFSCGLNDIVKFESIDSMSDIRGYRLETADGTTDITDIPDALKNAVIGLVWQKCANYSATPEDLTQYGFDTGATATITYAVTDNQDTGAVDDNGSAVTEDVENLYTFSVQIGAYTDDGYAYAKLPDSDMVYLINATAADALLLKAN